MRLFLAVALSPEVRESIERETECFSQQVSDLELKWVAQDNLHLTMLFLGEVEEEHLDDLRRAVSQATSELKPMHLQYGGFGSFPFRRPRVIWVGALSEPDEALIEAMRHLKMTCSEFADEVWRNSYPHITIARVRSKAGGPKALEEAIRAFRWGKIVSQDVNELTLYSSHLTKEGTRYEVVDMFPLGRQGRFSCDGKTIPKTPKTHGPVD